MIAAWNQVWGTAFVPEANSSMEPKSRVWDMLWKSLQVQGEGIGVQVSLRFGE